MGRKTTDERREQILDAFLATLAEHGYARATIARIAEAADLTPGLLHYHFKNKQAILLALTDRLVEAQSERLRLEVDRHGGPPAQLRAVIDAFLAVGASADPAAVAAWVTIAAEAIRQPEVAEEFHRALLSIEAVLTTLVAAGVASGDFDTGPLSPAACAAALLASIQGYFTLAATARDLIPSGTAADATWRMARGLLGMGGPS
jgi:TetR/AcrR family transcriptional regulator, transcriptional repressor of bet genes